MVAALKKVGVPVLIEPAASMLDDAYAQIDRLQLDDGLTVVGALHDLTAAARYAERPERLVLPRAARPRGRVVAAGTPGGVLSVSRIRPVHRAVVSVIPDTSRRPRAHPGAAPRRARPFRRDVDSG